ncbi:tRNA 2-selenouridine(34) synthase MnmH [Paenibacillus sp. TAB 01]|uniref:tRNA 2-selenouridine(34) synthase MnmH n=1 Tax=Paenibacillus sp. TAB 01 TaxID=3368988 RepID=UPI00375032ED
MFQDINVEELLELRNRGKVTLIDVRSPSEYTDFTIPGSRNIPFFDDEERAEIGTIYKQVSVQAAKERGLELISAKLPAFIKTFQQIEGPKAVFCWRGGMRSKTTATLLSLMGIRVHRLSGGIREYRRWVVHTLEHFKLHSQGYVINGLTGTGKTLILHSLKEQGYPVLDLEALAGHRGSIFGGIGLRAHNQKTFESLLLEELIRIGDAPYVLLEGESKRIGKAVIPDFIMDVKEAGVQLFIDLPIEERVKHILEDYKPWEHKEACLQAFRHIHKRIHTPIAKEIETHLLEDRFAEAVKLLLEHYYDPRYDHATRQYSTDPVIIQAASLPEAMEAVKGQLGAMSLSLQQ